MSMKKGGLLEQHIDKLAFGLVGIFSVVCLWLFVLSNPYKATLGGQKFGVGQIDAYINRQADLLAAELEKVPEIRPDPARPSRQFISRLDCSISDVDGNIYPRFPGLGSKPMEGGRVYQIPQIPDVTDVKVGVVRGAAYVPTEEVTVNTPYQSVSAELGDIDLVTVEGRIDVATLFKNFVQGFSSPRVRFDWRDKNLASPVFAAVELQRRQLLADGGWSDWSTVPRMKIDPYKVLLDVPGNLSELKYEVTLLMERFRDFSVIRNILQPQPYDFASLGTQWMSPGFSGEYAELVKRQEELKRREEYERQKAEYDRQRGGRITDRPSTTPGDRSTRRQPAPARDRRPQDDPRRRPQESYDMTMAQPYDAARTRRERMPEDVQNDFRSEMLNEKTSLENLRKSLLFWAHDDTAQPNSSYQYRIRAGVFNPIVGHDWFEESQLQYRDSVILWTAYSQATEVVKTQPMIQIFPLDILAEQDAVKIEVCKYYRGRWKSSEFNVRKGEPIGTVVRQQPAQATANMVEMAGYTGTGDEEPEKIDYTTGSVLVDVVVSNQWSGVAVLKRRECPEILYTDNGPDIKHMAVKERNWPDDLRSQYRLIKEQQSKETDVSDFGRTRTSPFPEQVSPPAREFFDMKTL